MDRRCNFVDCAKRSTLTLRDHEYCAGHFILTCYQRLEEPQEFEERDQENEVSGRAQRLSLLEIIDKATAGSLATGDLTNLEQSQLLDIILWASELVQRVRRGSP